MDPNLGEGMGGYIQWRGLRKFPHVRRKRKTGPTYQNIIECPSMFLYHKIKRRGGGGGGREKYEKSSNAHGKKERQIHNIREDRGPLLHDQAVPKKNKEMLEGRKGKICWLS